MDSARRGSSKRREVEAGLVPGMLEHGPGPSSCTLPSHPPVLFYLKFRHLAVVTVSLPVFAFVFCITYSWWWHYEWVTRTHCQVWNIAPSISASIGNFAPQKYVWKLAIALHSAPRLLLCQVSCDWCRLAPILAYDWLQLHHHHMRRVLSRAPAVRRGALLCCALNLAEILALLLLSVVPSVEDFHLHKLSFGCFLLFSALFIASSYYLHSRHRVLPRSVTDHRSLRYKRRLLTVNFVCMAAALYCYWRHNTRCEPGMYSVFSVFEYTVVLSNMAYHFTSYFDFYYVNIQIGTRVSGLALRGATRHE